MTGNIYLTQQPTGHLICQWHADPARAQIIATPSEDGTYGSWQVARLLQEAYENGRRHSKEEIRQALGIKETS
jgi:hypothetical protein